MQHFSSTDDNPSLAHTKNLISLLDLKNYVMVLELIIEKAKNAKVFLMFKTSYVLTRMPDEATTYMNCEGFQ